MTAETATAPEPEGREEEIDEVAEILQEPHPILIRGIECEIAPLKTREFLVMTRIISEGMGGRLALMSLGDEDDEAELAGKMAGMLVNSIPYAVDQVIDFVRVMVKPATNDPKEFQMVREELENPELEVLTGVLIAIADKEAGNLASLGKAFSNWWKTANLGEKIQKAANRNGT